jgi:ABC-type sugar transport system ATPase subunit
LPEVLANADRILVISDGQITGTFKGHGVANQEELLRAASPN